jgi:hypothetical protein
MDTANREDDEDEYDDDFGDEDDVIDVTNFDVEDALVLIATFDDDEDDTLVDNRPAILRAR